MSLSRIYTEDVKRERITEILDKALDGYTLIPALGSYKGFRERSLIIEVFNLDRASLVKIARAIGKANSQQSVIVMFEDGEIIPLETGTQHTVNGLVVDESDVEAESFGIRSSI